MQSRLRNHARSQRRPPLPVALLPKALLQLSAALVWLRANTEGRYIQVGLQTLPRDSPWREAKSGSSSVAWTLPTFQLLLIVPPCM